MKTDYTQIYDEDLQQMITDIQLEQAKRMRQKRLNALDWEKQKSLYRKVAKGYSK